MSASESPRPLVIGGSIAIDHVKTPTAEARNLLGGSASYAALAAARFVQPVHLIGVVGADFPQAPLDKFETAGITLHGVERSSGETFSWSGEYHDNMNDRTTHQVAVNVLENWQVQVPPSLRQAPIAVLANMAPENQLQLLDQLEQPSFVLADTMDLWIAIAHDLLHEVLRRIDLLVINESEARTLIGTPNLISAGKSLLEKGPRNVVIKLGEFGSILFSANPQSSSSVLPGVDLFRCGAFPLHELVDPTGAGDSFLGALAGFLAGTGKPQFGFEDIRKGVVMGTVAASFTCEAFSTQRLRSISQKDLLARRDLLKSITHWP